MRSAKLRCVARSRFAKLRSRCAALRSRFPNLPSRCAATSQLREATSRYASQLRATHRNLALLIATSRSATSQLRVTYNQRCNGGPSRPWRSVFKNFIAPIEIKCDCLADIMCTYEHKRHAILCVYMPCMSTQSVNDDRLIFLELEAARASTGL